MLAEKILGQNPYQGWSVEGQQTDFRTINDPIFSSLIELIKPKMIIEVGSWKGASAIHMAKLIQAHQLDTQILCIDTWLGSPEHWLSKGVKVTPQNQKFAATWGFDNLKLKQGYPSIYYTFLTNVILENCQQMITPFPSTSENAVKVLKKLQITADLIYIDAAHEYEPALRDMKLYWDLLSPSGVLLCDDYISHQFVTQAAIEFARAHANNQIFGKPGKCLIPKSRKYRFEISPLFGT